MNQVGYGIIERPHVTATMPVYNEECCIRKCILSLLNDDFKSLEILVVDGGSSAAICENLKIIHLRKTHKGVGASRNLGVCNVKGNILVFNRCGYGV